MYCSIPRGWLTGWSTVQSHFTCDYNLRLVTDEGPHTSQQPLHANQGNDDDNPTQPIGKKIIWFRLATYTPLNQSLAILTSSNRGQRSTLKDPHFRISNRKRISCLLSFFSRELFVEDVKHHESRMDDS